MPRNFDPDETALVRVELSAKDWLVICETLRGVAKAAVDTKLSNGLAFCALEITEQCLPEIRKAAKR